MFYIKNSLARKALELREKEWNNPQSTVYDLYQEIGHKDLKGLDTLSKNFREVQGCIFANGNLNDVATLIDKHVLQSNGYIGYVSDMDVLVPAGPTSIDIKMTNFFQKQNIPTKVENKKIKIEKEIVLCGVGEVVNGTHLKIIELLELCPFKFKVQIKKLWDKGNLFGKEVVFANNEETLEKFNVGVSNLNALALATGITTEGSVSHLVSRVAKGLANVSFVSNVKAPELSLLVDFLQDPSKLQAQTTTVSDNNNTNQVEKKVEVQQEEVVEDVDLGGGMFGDDEDW